MKKATRLLAVFALSSALWVSATATAFAGNPHFVKSATEVTVSGDTVTATFKEAGLGDEEQVHVVLSGDAQCINKGGNHPQAGNKETFDAEGDFPVQNGRAEGSLTLVAEFQPDCSPPMTVAWTNLVLTDETNGISFTP